MPGAEHARSGAGDATPGQPAHPLGRARVPATASRSPVGAAGAVELRPDPVLVVAICGRRDVDLTGEDAGRLGHAADALFAALADECARIVAADSDLFGSMPARLRIVTNLTGGADLVVATAAQRTGAEIRVVLPYDPAIRGAEMPDVAVAAMFTDLMAGAGDPFVLDGSPGVPQAHERAAAAILDASDILVAVWADGLGRGRDPTGDIVQEAVDRRMPVLLLPERQEDGVALIDDPDELLLPPVAADLPRVAFGENIDRVLGRAFAPPVSPHERRALREWLDEPRRLTSHRPEYRLLLKLAEARRHGSHLLSQPEEWRQAQISAERVSKAAGQAVERLEALSARVEVVAGFYGEQVRSGIVARYILAAFGSIMVAVFALVAPGFGFAWLLIQAAIAVVTIAEARVSDRRRWNERWLDYRSLAERLRCDRFLQPIGIATVRLDAQTSAEDPAWMRWMHIRHLRTHWAGGRIAPDVVKTATRHLVEVEIPSQIGYHEGAVVRARSLSRRLRILGVGAVAAALAACFGLMAVRASGDSSQSLYAVMQVMLIVLPAIYLAANGLRAEAGFDLAASRSEQALGTLHRVRRRIEARPATFDRLVQASRAAAAAMILDTVDWRIGVQRSRQPYRAASPDRPSSVPAPAVTPGSEYPRR